MDIVELKPDTKIDQSFMGMTITTGKPTVSSAILQTPVPPSTIYNPPPEYQAFLDRFYFVKDVNITTTAFTSTINVDIDFVMNLKNFTNLKIAFGGLMIPSALEFKLIVHSPMNVNGLLCFYFDPEISKLRTVMQDNTSIPSGTRDQLTLAMNLDGAFVAAHDSTEVTLVVPLVYPTNYPNPGVDLNFGNVVLANATDFFFGTGITSVRASIYVRPLGVLCHPLQP